MILIAKHELENNSTKSTVEASVRDSVWRSVWRSVRDSVRTSVRNAVRIYIMYDNYGIVNNSNRFYVRTSLKMRYK